MAEIFLVMDSCFLIEKYLHGQKSMKKLIVPQQIIPAGRAAIILSGSFEVGLKDQYSPGDKSLMDIREEPPVKKPDIKNKAVAFSGNLKSVSVRTDGIDLRMTSGKLA